MPMTPPAPVANDAILRIGDTFSFVTVLGSLAGLLPAIATIFTIIWTAIRIYETKTVQGLVSRRREKRKLKAGALARRAQGA